MNKGIFYALTAYLFWGLFPVYWKLLQHVPSEEILLHRIIWSFLFFIILTYFRKEGTDIINKFKSTPNKTIFILPAFLIGTNWGVYIWAINHGFVIETSLGYFISPLISVFLGVFYLHEKLRSIQWLAIGIAAAGVIVMTILIGSFPWISLYLAGSWGLYGLLRKKSPFNSIEGLTFETAVLLLPALSYLLIIVLSGKSYFLFDIKTTLLLICSGVASGLPLLLFIIGARMVKLSLIGILQYFYPTIIFLLGYFVYNEPVNQAKLTGFIFIWIALIIYSVEGRLAVLRKISPSTE